MPQIPVKGIIVHSMAEYVKTPDGIYRASDFLRKIGLSVHGFIHPNGEYEMMLRSPNKAHHAGVSKWGPWSHLNNHFLGIEVLVPGIHDWSSFKAAINNVEKSPYTKAQMEMTAHVVGYWMYYYLIPHDNIVRHSDCAGDHIRGAGKGKIDPGPAFDWDWLQKRLKKDVCL